MNIKGVWKGYYEYGIGYDPPYFGERVEIFLTILGGEGDFEGFCIEEASPFSIQEPSNIKGSFEEGVVSFVKSYQNQYEIEDVDYTLIKKEGKPMEVYYDGIYNQEYDCLFGSWVIDSEPFEVDGQMVQYVCQGTWKLMREEEDV